MRIRNRKSERMNQMQTGTRYRTHAPDVARILRNLRIKKNDVEHFY